MAQEPRFLPSVLTAIINEIPEGEELRSHLEKVRDSARYSAPENMRMWWVKAAECLELLPKPGDLNAWQQRVVNIFMDKVEAGARRGMG